MFNVIHPAPVPKVTSQYSLGNPPFGGLFCVMPLKIPSSAAKGWLMGQVPLCFLEHSGGGSPIYLTEAL